MKFFVILLLATCGLLFVVDAQQTDDDSAPSKEVVVVSKYDNQLSDGHAFGYLLSDDTAVHQETHNVQVGEELVPFSKGNYTYRTSKGIKILVEWTADRENGFRAFESFI